MRQGVGWLEVRKLDFDLPQGLIWNYLQFSEVFEE